MSGRLPKRSTRRVRSSPGSNRGAGPRKRDDGAATFTASEWLGDDKVFTPLGYEPGYDYPLLVWLSDPAGPTFDLGRVMRRLSLRNFLAVQPAAATDSAGGIPAGNREAGVWRAIDRVCERASVHPDRIYLIGHGAGGSDAFRIACRHPQAFAGVVSLGGPFPLSESLFARLHDVRRLPMLLCCHRQPPRQDERSGPGGPADDIAAHTDRTLRLFHAAGAMLALRIYPGRNDLSKAILGDVNRWLMDEVCGTATPLRSTCAS
jgi:phospholipase/carboxylesterase